MPLRPSSSGLRMIIGLLLMQVHGCVYLRLGSTAIGICTKEGVETLAIDFMPHDFDATEKTELHQDLSSHPRNP